MASMKKLLVLLLCLVLVSTASLGFAAPVQMQGQTGTLGVIKGATPIQNGMAIHADDFTIFNDKIAASFAVGTNNYWNMTKGSILDVAVVNDGKFGNDLVNDVEFLNDYWTATGSFNNEDLLNVPKKDIQYTVTDDKVVVTAKTRYWTAGHKQPLNVTITYTLEKGKNYISMNTKVENPVGNEPYSNMNSGYSLSTLGAPMYGPFGFYPDVKTTGIRIGTDPEVNEGFGTFVATYGKDYAVMLQTDGANAYKGSSGYKDLYVNRTIEGGKTYNYTGELLVVDSGKTAPIMERYIAKDNVLKAVKLSGTVKDSKGKAISGAYVIVSKSGSYKQTVKSNGADALKKDIMQPLVWTITDKDGRYACTLPAGDYQLHAEATGYTASEGQSVKLEKDARMDFSMKDGAKAVFQVMDENGKAVPFKVEISGATSSVKSLGGTVQYADPKTNKAIFSLSAPEKPLTFTFTRDNGFTSLPVVVTRTVKPGTTLWETVVIPTVIPTVERNWYAMDNHQHSNIGDGATLVNDLFKAQMAARLDLTIISDHDSMANNAAMDKLSKVNGKAFISSLEVSPGWGHWGILGADYSKPVISPNLKPAEIIRAGHDMGALVVLNHPYSDYGFLNNRAGVKGGFDKGSEDFDLIELQSTMNLDDAKNMDKKALDAAMGYWNKGMKKYLSAGSDQHDATSGLFPGIIRLYAHIEGKLSTESYLKAIKEGHAYVTMGPILTPIAGGDFGTTAIVKAGDKHALAVDVQAVNGIKKVDLYVNGKIVETKTYTKMNEAVRLSHTLTPDQDSWYCIVAQDDKGKYAVSNPVWVDVK